MQTMCQLISSFRIISHDIEGRSSRYLCTDKWHIIRVLLARDECGSIVDLNEEQMRGNKERERERAENTKDIDC